MLEPLHGSTRLEKSYNFPLSSIGDLGTPQLWMADRTVVAFGLWATNSNSSSSKESDIWHPNGIFREVTRWSTTFSTAKQSDNWFYYKYIKTNFSNRRVRLYFCIKQNIKINAKIISFPSIFINLISLLIFDSLYRGIQIFFQNGLTPIHLA